MKQTKQNSLQMLKTQTSQPKLQKIIKGNPHFTFIQSGKVKCSLTGHQFAPTLDNYNRYLKSKSYKRGIEAQFDISEYEEFLTPFRDNDHFLFCRLTGTKLPKKKTALERHINSRKFKHRYQKLLAQRQESQEGSEQLVDEDAEQEEEIQIEEEVKEEVVVKVKNGKKKGKKGK